MDVSIGIRNVARELSLEVEGDPATFAETVSEAMKSGGPLTIKDARGRTVVVPPDAVGYVLIGDGEERRVGFAI
ncbi:MAG TPA: DUF3107 domain-containing protein [Actinomycetaceae bacterium]|nr:DUF3107 domain-containing protein [Actinomycetaceae bacterium]